MADFEFLQNPISKKWVILAPRRAKRTNIKTTVAICPFCPGKEGEEEELYRISAEGTEHRADDWKIRVIPNKFPFTENHEIVIHSPDHHKNFDELPFEQVDLIFKTYRQRFNVLSKNNKWVYIFHNKGHAAGESLPHPHTQIAVVPENMTWDIPKLDMGVYQAQNSKLKSQNYTFAKLSAGNSKLQRFFSRFNRDQNDIKHDVLETDSFFVFCPASCEWPDEVWIAPKQNGNFFGSINDNQLTDLAFTVSRLIQIFDVRHGYEFPFNFYIAPFKNWYLRFIPRLKIIGGFELGTKIIVNTQRPQETFIFIKENFWKPDNEKIKSLHQAEYRKSV